jgi:hypothetical protein
MDNPFRDLDSSENPYANFSTVTPSASAYPPATGSMVGHVRVVSILMIVQGSLVVLLGLVLGAMGFAMPVILNTNPAFREDMVDGPPIWIFPVIYGSLGVFLLAMGILNIVAGVQNYRFRGRGLGIFALCAGMAASITCYCAPTAIALAVYGLIVYFNQPVVLAFQMARQGLSGDQILAAFYTRAYPPRSP